MSRHGTGPTGPVARRPGVGHNTQMESAAPSRGPRFCRTPEESFQAGWDDGADDPPLTDAQRTQLAALLGPYWRPAEGAA